MVQDRISHIQSHPSPISVILWIDTCWLCDSRQSAKYISTFNSLTCQKNQPVQAWEIFQILWNTCIAKQGNFTRLLKVLVLNCWLRGRASVLLSEGHWFDFPGLHVEVSLGKIMNPKLLPTCWSAPDLAATGISVWMYVCMYELVALDKSVCWMP